MWGVERGGDVRSSDGVGVPVIRRFFRAWWHMTGILGPPSLLSLLAIAAMAWLLSAARIEGEARIRCEEAVDNRAEVRRGLQAAHDRAEVRGAAPDALLVLEEARDALPPKVCTKTDGKWEAREVD